MIEDVVGGPLASVCVNRDDFMVGLLGIALKMIR